jgi:hypothetical protein
MKNLLIKLLSGIAVCVIATPAYSLTIIPTFDSSITGATNAAAITNAINFAIGIFQSNIVDNVTVNITFVNMNTGLGMSSTFGASYNYSNYIAALKTSAASVNDTNALSKLPDGPTDPVIGGTQIHLTTAQSRVLGLDSYSGLDSTISLNMSLMNFTRPPIDPDKYDLISVTEHEVDEVLGISSGLPNTSVVWPADLFRYTTNLVRTFTTSGADNAYFSVDGTNLVARYNMQSGADYGDWWSFYGANRWAPPGITPHTQVQDAYGSPGVYEDLGVSELTALDVVGWTLAVTATTPPVLKIVHSGASQFTLSWTNTASGYVLQERTNLISGSWAFSTTGSTNPAVLLTPASGKFYRLYNPGSSSQSPAHTAAVVPAAHTVYEAVTRVFPSRQP